MSVSNNEVKANWPKINQIWDWYSKDTNIIVKIAKLACAILATPFAAIYDLTNRMFSCIFPTANKPKEPEIAKPVENKDAKEKKIVKSSCKYTCSSRLCYGTAAATAITAAFIFGIKIGIIAIA